MKSHCIILNLILLGALLICLLSCGSSSKQLPLGDYTVIDIRHIHDLAYATRVKARLGQRLLYFSRVLVTENKQGERLLIVRGSGNDSAVYYKGIANDAMTFQLVAAGADPETDPEPGQILRFPKDVKRIELWGNHFEVIAVSPYGIQCRVAAPDTGI